MSRFLSARFAGLEAYTPGEQPQDMQYVKLNTNESPYPPSPEVFARINGEEIGKLQLYPDPEGKVLRQKLADLYGVTAENIFLSNGSPEVFARINGEEIGKLQLYPDPEGKVLRQKLADLYGVTAENIFLSNGSDDILNFAFMAFCDETHGAMFPEISYGFYPVYADLYGVQAKQMPLQADFTISGADCCKNEAMVVIANPNAPTGLELPQNDIEKIIQSNPDHVVIIDEAYIDFGGTSCVDLIHKYDNLLVVQTFSKSRSMAGARLGFAIASKGIIEDLNKIKYSTNPYNINRITLAAGEAAVDSNDYYMENCKKIAATRERTTAELRKLGFMVLDSVANFIFAKSDAISGADLYAGLKKKGVLVRYFGKEKIKDFVRITVLDSVANFIFAKSDAISGADLYAGLKKKGVLVRYFGKEKIKDFVRITIGTDEQMDILLEKTKELLAEGGKA